MSTRGEQSASGRRTNAIRIALWAAILIAVAASLVAFRESIDHAHVSLLFLLVVLVGTAEGGRKLGFALAGAAFLLFNWFFVPPYGTLFVAKPIDLLVLVAFLVTSIVAAQLLARAHAQAEEARRRADEINRLSALGAETLSVARAEDALLAIENMVCVAIGVAECTIYMRSAPDQPLMANPTRAGERETADSTMQLVSWVASGGVAAAERLDGTVRVAWENEDAGSGSATLDTEKARLVLLPLRVHERTVGVLQISDPRSVKLDEAQWRLLGALSQYAAFAVERVRLSVEAERSDALREADRLKDALLASVSHDLRTPLTTIKALAHDLRALGDERIEIIEQEADRLNRFVIDLLELSRLNAGSLSLRIEVNAADDLVGVAVQQTSGILDGRRLDVELDATAPVLFGWFDLVHSVRVLVNLIQNACKYSPEGSSITLGVRQEGGSLAFDVSDQGSGVAATERERIFAPFYRPDGVPPDAGSAGLGLAIARGLAVAQHGSLTYEPRPNGGSTFTFRLPSATLEEVASKSL